MSCNLTTGFSLACRDSVGGIKGLYVTELANKKTLVSATDGTISSIALLTGKQFWQVDQVKETSNWEETRTVSEENGTAFSDQKLKVIFNKGAVAQRAFVKLLAQNLLMWIVLDRNGTYWLLGEQNGMAMATSKYASGTKMGDRNGYELDFMGKEENMAQTIDPTQIAALLVPGL